MRFDRPLVPGTLLRRYQRFLADVRLADGAVVTAHSPNTGRMAGCVAPGSRVWLSESDRPGRRLRHTWEIASDGDTLVGVHTGRTNRLAEEALRAGAVPALAAFPRVRREVRVGERSRLDLLLERDDAGDGGRAGGGPPARCFVEVKNVTLGEGGVALFPDAVTERGVKHLEELVRLVAQGHAAAMLYVVQRGDCDRVRPADAIDPTYGLALRRALGAGVGAWGLRFVVTPEGITFDRVLPVECPAVVDVTRPGAAPRPARRSGRTAAPASPPRPPA